MNLRPLSVPLSSLQSDILRLIASTRDPESYVAGGIAINRVAARISADIDIFHDRAERVATAATTDAATLIAAGYEIRWLQQQPALFAASVRRGPSETRLEWVTDSDFRFFPTVQDSEFGYVLHPVDLAINKVMATVSRSEPRDLVDLITLHERVLPLGALAWAAVNVAPGFSPEGIIAEISRNSRHPANAFEQLAAEPPIDAALIMQKLREALTKAATFFAAMPSEKAGLLFLKHGKPVEPDPTQLANFNQHAPQRRGHWPTSPDITAAMLEHLQRQKI
jgi:hypothetical protein